jgi:hypothetical protein
MRRENEKCLLAKRVIPSNISFMKLLDMMVVNSYSYSGTSGSKNVSITETDRQNNNDTRHRNDFFVKSMNGLKHLER